MVKTKIKRPVTVEGKTIKIRTGCGHIYITIGFVEGVMYEMFCRLGHGGGCASSQTEALGRLVSMLLQNRTDPSAIVKQLRAISCHQPYGIGKNKVWSCADSIAIALQSVIGNGNKVAEKTVVKDISEEGCCDHEQGEKCDKIDCCAANEIGQCPDCGGIPYREEGCMKCTCGWSKCS